MAAVAAPAQPSPLPSVMLPAPAAASSSSGPERLLVPALCQPSLMGELPNVDAISGLLAKHIPPHLRPVRDIAGVFPPNESPEDPDLALAMRSNAWRRIAVYARERIISAGAPAPSLSASSSGAAGLGQNGVDQELRSIEPAGPNDVSTVLRWWNVRLQALLRLRLYSQFRLELESLWAILKRTTIPRHLVQTPAPTPAPSAPTSQALSRMSISSEASLHTQSAQTAPAYIRPTVRYARLLDSPVVPFPLHVLRAREPLLAGDSRAALEKCHALLQRCRVMQRRFVRVAVVDGEEAGDEAVELGARAEASMWEERARRMTVIIAFILLDFEDYSAAVSLLRPLMIPKPSTPTQQAYMLLFARLFLEAGAIDSAEACIGTVSSALNGAEDSEAVSAAAVSPTTATATRKLLEVTEALLAMWKGDYALAESRLKATLASAGQDADGHIGEDGDPATVNNLALATFYQGRVDESTNLLERLLQDEPSTASSAEAVIFNLITMHELRSDDSLSHKRRILVHVAQWAGDGGGTSCLKLT